MKRRMLLMVACTLTQAMPLPPADSAAPDEEALAADRARWGARCSPR
jgi:hypothetical protein